VGFSHYKEMGRLRVENSREHEEKKKGNGNEKETKGKYLLPEELKKKGAVRRTA